MPSGTLANQIAVRTLAGDNNRVLTQQVSHLFNDCGDCLQKLNRLNIIPLGGGNATFTLDGARIFLESAYKGIDPESSFNGYYLKVNESLNHMQPDQLARHFINAAG